MAIATIDDKWRVTIPKEARKAMRLSPRVPVSMKLRKDSLVILPLRKGARRKADSLSWLKG
jgi:bifunctional DNA-binding transcriptional regulator/antitoxin component of YhaV-PrlF toxin-antitoxin module